MITIYHNPRCRKSRETLQLLEQKEAQISIREYLKEPLSTEELSGLVDMLEIKPFDLIRRNEEVFKSQFKGKDLSDEEWLEVLASNPKLIERPIVVSGNRAVLGRPPENVLTII